MKAKIKSFSSPETDDLRNFRPDTDAYSLLIEFAIGPVDEPGEEIFAVEVVTPLWFMAALKSTNSLFGRNFLIVLDYNFNLVYNRMKTLIESFDAETWHELALKISRYAHWEFEDIQGHGEMV